MKKLVILLFTLVFLAGCSGKEAPAATTQQPDATKSIDEQPLDPEWAWLLEEPTGPDATKVTLELTKESLAAHLDFYFQLHRNDEVTYMDAIAASRRFVVTDYTKTDDTVTATVTVTVPDVYTIITAMDFSAYQTAEETDAALRSAIESAVPQEKQMTITFTAGSNRWIPELDETAADACYGGLLTYLQEQTEGVA